MRFGQISEESYREFLINKIANDLGNKGVAKPDEEAKRETQYNDNLFEKIASLVEKTKEAVARIKELEKEAREQKEENKSLSLQLIAKERSKRSLDLANQMLEKDLIKKAELDSEVDKIMDMDDNNFKILKEAVSRVKEEKTAEEGLDTISGLLVDNEKTKKPSTLGDSIIED